MSGRVNKEAETRESKTQNVGAMASHCLQDPPWHQAVAVTALPSVFPL